MTQITRSLRQFAVLGTLSLLAACVQTDAPQPGTAPLTPDGDVAWYHVSFDTGVFIIDPDSQIVVSAVAAFMQQHPAAIATIIGKTDTVGSAAFNMHLSHQRADAVRDSLVYRGNVDASRVETRWTGEASLDVATADNAAQAANRVVDIAIH